MLISMVFSLFSTLATLAIFSLPFCALQLALCKFCPWKPLQFAPLALSGGGFLWSCWYIGQHSNWDVLLGVLILFPSLLGLAGSGLGWYLWKKRSR